MSTPANVDLNDWRWADDDNAAHESCTLLSSESTTYEVALADLDTGFNIIGKLYNDGQKDSGTSFTLQANIDGAGFFTVTNATNGVRMFDGSDTDGATSTTENLTTVGTYVGSVYEDGTGTITQAIAGGNSYEFYWCVTFRSADLSGGESIDFQFLDNGSVCTNDSGTTPNATIAVPPDTLQFMNVFHSHEDVSEG